MEIPLSPIQAAKELGVATVTVYKWTEAGLLAHEKVKHGHAWRIHIDPASVEAKRIEIDAKGKHGEAGPMVASAEEYVKRYQTLIGTVPPLYGAFRQGRCTFPEMMAEVRRRFQALS